MGVAVGLGIGSDGFIGDAVGAGVGVGSDGFGDSIGDGITVGAAVGVVVGLVFGVIVGAGFAYAVPLVETNSLTPTAPILKNANTSADKPNFILFINSKILLPQAWLN